MNEYSPGEAPEQANPVSGSGRGAARAAAWIVGILGLLCGAAGVLDMDFHWHLALGRHLVSRGFPTAEPFSHLPAEAPDHQAWLTDAAFAILDRIRGIWAIRFVMGAAFAAGCLSVLRLARRRTQWLGVALFPVAIYVALAMARLRLRPDVFTLALVPLFVELLEGRPSWRRAGAVLSVAALWANLHPAAILAGLLALPGLWRPRPIRVAYVVAAWGGLCLTPDGIHGLLRYAADTAQLRALIPEWQRIWERPLAEFRPEWVVIAGVGAILAWALAETRRMPAADAGGLRAPDALRALLGLGLAASAVRFLFALFLPVLWAVGALSRTGPSRAPLRAAAWVAVAALFVAFPASHLREVAAGLRIGGTAVLGPDSPAFPVEATRWLDRSGLAGNLAHPAGWGGYLALHLAPRFKTATDGRVTHFGPQIAREWSEGVDSPAREDIFARRGIDVVVVPRPMLPLFRDDQPYEPIYSDSFAVVLLRLEGPNVAGNRRVLKEATKQRR